MCQILVEVGLQVGVFYVYIFDKQMLLVDLLCGYMQDLLVEWFDDFG